MFQASLGIVDYIICVLVLSVSAMIGIYFGCFGSKQRSATEYMYGKGRTRAIPVGLSIYSSAVSALLIVGVPTEIYSFGTQFMMFYVGCLLSIIFAWCFVLPVFCGELNIKTPYEYFELRFNYSVRVLLTSIHVVDMLFYIPAVLFAATIVFSEAANIPVQVCTTVVGGICLIYTLLGGFSAVIWTDAFQATLMLVSCIFVLFKAIANVGGFTEMWDRGAKGGRINFLNMDPNPFRRLTFWSALIGSIFIYSGHSYCSASCMQRYMALKKETSGRISTIISSCLLSFYGIILSFTGVAMYAQYYECDPVTNKDVSGPSKLVPYFIAQTVQDIPGLLGLFNAGLLSAGLSTMSAELNSVATLIYHCFIKRFWKNTNGEKEGAKIMKWIVLIFGILCLLIAPTLNKAKYIFPLILGVSGITFGLKLGLLVLGTTIPKSNSIGAIFGVITGAIILCWLQVGSMLTYDSSSEVLPVSIAHCTSNNITIIKHPVEYRDEPLFVYKLSFMYYSMASAVITIAVSMITSYFTGFNNVEAMDPNLFIPCVRANVVQCNIPEVEMLNKNENSE